MIRIVPTKDKYSSSESRFVNGKLKTKYFHFYCDICGVKHPKVCVNEFLKKERFGECEICWDCQNDLYYAKNRKCKCCKNKLKNLKKVIKLYYLDNIFYFCNHKCYYRFVKLKHPTSKKEWDKIFSKLSDEKKKIYYSRLRKVKRRIKELTSDFGDNYHLKKVRHPYIWHRPKCN